MVKYKSLAKKYWNNIKGESNLFSSNYRIKNKNVAIYRFRHELDFLNQYAIPGNNYLDLGFGTGNFINAWKSRYDLSIGVDFSDYMLKIAKKRFKNSKNVHLISANVLDFDKYIPKNTRFSLIFIGGCLMYLSDDEIDYLIKKLKKVLTKNGHIIARESIATKKRIVEHKKDYFAIRRRTDEYMDLFKNALGPEFNIRSNPNYYYIYAYMIMRYITILPFLEKKINHFNNFLIEYVFLFIPLKIFSIFKGNLISDYYFIIRRYD